MKTSSPISTISFNSKNFLIGKLNEMLNAKILEFWAVIEHQPEPDENHDEAGGKVHYHVYMEPAIRVQTVDIKDMFKEPDFQTGKPKGCINIVKSKFDDWYMYGLHDEEYLLSKGQSRQWSYSPEEVITNDADTLLFKVRNIDRSQVGVYVKMAMLQKAGGEFRDFMIINHLHPRDVLAYQKAWNILETGGTYRNGREGHANSYEEHLEGQETFRLEEGNLSIEQQID